MSIIKDKGFVDIMVLDSILYVFFVHFILHWIFYHFYLYDSLEQELTNYGHHLFMYGS